MMPVNSVGQWAWWVLVTVAFLGIGSPLGAQSGSPAGPVPPALLRARRAALAAQMDGGVALLLAQRERVNDPPASDYPQDTDYREDNDYFYLTGIETPGGVLLLRVQEGQLVGEELFLPERNPAREQWTGVKLGPGEDAARLTGLSSDQILPLDQLEEHLGRALRRTAGETPRFFFKRDQRTPKEPLVDQMASRPGIALEDLLAPLARLRAVKDADELRRLRRAIEISAAGHVAAMKRAQPGLFEYSLEAEAEYTFRRLGAERLGYPSIVGTGMNGTTLHYDKNRAELHNGELVVMDMGAEFGYYSADITRTIPVSGTFTKRQQDLYSLVLATQQAAIDAVQPGVTIRQLNSIARDYMRKHSGDLCGERTCDAYFIHGLSHHIGMDVHDPSGGGALEAGMVLTIEPGVYLAGEGIGIRIEDDILVTPTGHEVLSAGVPRTIEGIEQLMGTRKSQN